MSGLLLSLIARCVTGADVVVCRATLRAEFRAVQTLGVQAAVLSDLSTSLLRLQVPCLGILDSTPLTATAQFASGMHRAQTH